MRFLYYLARLLLLPVLLLGTLVVLLALALSDLIPVKRKPASTLPVDATKATIVIPNWNGKDLLEQCLPSLIKAVAFDGQAHEIIVVDNASTDESVAFLRGNYPQVKVLPLERNLGFSGGCNTGAQHAKHDIVLFLNNDMIVEEDFLRPILEPFHDPLVFAVSAQIFLWDKTKRREETGCTRGNFRGGMLKVWHEAIEDQDHLWPTLYPGGGSSAVDKRKFLEIGGFDELYHPFYGEDTDLGYKAWRRGWQVLYEPKSVVYHKHRGTIGKTFPRDYIDDIVEKNRFLFVWQNITDWRFLPTHFFFMLATLIFSTVSGSLRPRIYLSAFKSLPRVMKGRISERQFRAVPDREVLDLSQNPLAFKDRFEEPQPHTSGKRLRILYVVPYFPYPPRHGGAVRMYNMIKQHGKRHDVTLLSFIDRMEEREGIPEMLRYCVEVRTVLRYLSPIDWNPFGFRPYAVAEFFSDKMWKEYRCLVAKRNFDVIQIDYTQMAQYVSPSKHLVNLLTEHDLSLISYQRRIGFNREMPAKAQAYLEWLRVLRFELESCKRFDAVLTVTQKEGEELKSFLPDTRIFWDAPTGVDVDEFAPPALQMDRGNRLLFVGYFRHAPNIDAALYLGRAVYPLIKREIPDVSLTIVGMHPTDDIRALQKDPSINVTGFVEDVKPFYHNHAIFMAPIRTGAGVRVKILEAMAAGIPVVTTSIGAEGIKFRSGEDLIIADDASNIAKETVSLLKSRELQGRLSQNGRIVVERYYDYKILAENLEGFYDELLVAKKGYTSALSPLVEASFE